MKHLGLIFLILPSLLESCSNRTTEKNKDSTIEFSEKYLVCDTCTSTILVHHDDFTTCGEITVDSGTVYLTSAILKKANSLGINFSSTEDTFVGSPNMISLRELFFSDKHDINKLWTDTVDFKDFYKTFRLSGKVIDVKRRVLDNGVTEDYPSLFFKSEKVEEIDTTYSKKIRGL